MLIFVKDREERVRCLDYFENFGLALNYCAITIKYIKILCLTKYFLISYSFEKRHLTQIMYNKQREKRRIKHNNSYSSQKMLLRLKKDNLRNKCF